MAPAPTRRAVAIVLLAALSLATGARAEELPKADFAPPAAMKPKRFQAWASSS